MARRPRCREMLLRRTPCASRGYLRLSWCLDILAALFQRCHPGAGRLRIAKPERIDVDIRHPSCREKDVSAPCRAGLLVRGTYLLSAPFPRSHPSVALVERYGCSSLTS